MPFPRITFGIIVLNGEPFTRYTLRALYPYAHEIIVVEGAAPAAANVATPDGHSIDGTLEVLRHFKATEDPEDKLRIITREGFWTEKDEMSQAYAECATGDYLWQVDVDEFYKDEDIQAIIAMLRDDPTITAMSFKTLTFWGAPDYVVDGWYLQRGNAIFHRLFKWGEGYRYITHRPPTVHDDQGRDLRGLHWVDSRQLSKRGILMYHYSLLLPKQVIAKSDYYGNADWIALDGAARWAQENYLQLKNPFRVHNVYQWPSWLVAYSGEHPRMVAVMWRDIQNGVVNVDTRDNTDVEALLRSFRYRAGRFYWRNLYTLRQFYHGCVKVIKKITGMQ